MGFHEITMVFSAVSDLGLYKDDKKYSQGKLD